MGIYFSSSSRLNHRYETGSGIYAMMHLIRKKKIVITVLGRTDYTQVRNVYALIARLREELLVKTKKKRRKEKQVEKIPSRVISSGLN